MSGPAVRSVTFISVPELLARLYEFRIRCAESLSLDDDRMLFDVCQGLNSPIGPRGNEPMSDGYMNKAGFACSRTEAELEDRNGTAIERAFASAYPDLVGENERVRRNAFRRGWVAALASLPVAELGLLKFVQDWLADFTAAGPTDSPREAEARAAIAKATGEQS
jgi:hypothetical protein